MNHRSQHLGNRSFRSGHDTHQAKHIEPIKWSVKELLSYQLSLVTHHFSLPQVPSRPHHLFFCHFSFSLLALRFFLVSFPTFPSFSFVSSFLLFPPYLSYFFRGRGEVNMASAAVLQRFDDAPMLYFRNYFHLYINVWVACKSVHVIRR